MSGKKDIVFKWLEDNESKVFGMTRKETLKELAKLTGLKECTLNLYYNQWKVSAVSPNSIPKKNKVYQDNEAREKIVIMTESEKRRIKKLKVKGNEVPGEFYKYRLNKKGISVLDPKRKLLKTFKTMDEIIKFEMDEDIRFQREMQEIKDVFKLSKAGE